MYTPIWKFIDVFIINCRFSGLVPRQPSLLWQPFCASLVGGLPHVGFQECLCDDP